MSLTFRLNKGVSREAFVEAAQAISVFARKRDGFVSRRLSCNDDGIWIEHIEWKTLEAAMSAAAEISNDPTLGPCMNMIEGPSVTLHHTTLEVSIN